MKQSLKKAFIAVLRTVFYFIYVGDEIQNFLGNIEEKVRIG